MIYLPEIQAAAADPEALEALYQDARQTKKEAAFQEALQVCYQDAPDICFLKIQKELAEGEEGSLPARALSLTDQELEEYKVSHAPKGPRRRS